MLLLLNKSGSLRTINPMSSSLVTLILFASLFLCTVQLWKQRKSPKNIQLQRLPLPPGPTPWPLIGSVPEMLRNKPVFSWIHRLMKETNTDVSLIRVGNTNIVPVLCPIIAREILKNKDAIFASRPPTYASGMYSGGYLATIFTPNNEQWKKMRKILASEIISLARHNWLRQKRAEEADNLVFFVHNLCKYSKRVNLRSVTRHYGVNVYRKTMFGKRYIGDEIGDGIGGPGAQDIEHEEAIFTALKYVFAFSLCDYFPFLVGLDLDGQQKFVRDAYNTITKHQNPIVNQRIHQWKTCERKEMDDLLDVFVTLKDSHGNPLLTPDEIKHQVLELGLAIPDNPSNAVEWAMAEMINQPELLQKATEEIDRVVGKERLVQESDIPSLNYVKACAREAFRLHPLYAFNAPHVSTEDTNVGGFFIPKGSHVLLSRCGLGRNPKVWDNPLKFDPDRHIKDGNQVVLTEHDLRFISFSTGRRGCPGFLLGTCMTTMLLARLLQCFSWTPPNNALSVDLAEATEELVLAKPLTLVASPRLPPHITPISPKAAEENKKMVSEPVTVCETKEEEECWKKKRL